MKHQTLAAIFSTMLLVCATSTQARDNDRVAPAQRHGRDYTPLHDYRNDAPRDDDRRHDDHRSDDHRHGGHDSHHSHQHGWGHGDTIYADVIFVEPVVEFVQVASPSQECHRDGRVYHESHAGGPGMVLGGVIGATIGQDIARNSGNDAAVVAGTLIGAMIGHDIGRSHTTVVSEPRVHCETVQSYHDERRVVGYRVKYRYRNRVYFTRTDYNPGPRIEINISLND